MHVNQAGLRKYRELVDRAEIVHQTYSLACFYSVMDYVDDGSTDTDLLHSPRPSCYERGEPKEGMTCCCGSFIWHNGHSIPVTPSQDRLDILTTNDVPF